MHSESLGETALALTASAIASFFRVRGGDADPAARVAVLVVEYDERLLIAQTVGVSEDVFVHVTVVREEVVKQEVVHFREQRTTVQQR